MQKHCIATHGSILDMEAWRGVIQNTQVSKIQKGINKKRIIESITQSIRELIWGWKNTYHCSEWRNKLPHRYQKNDLDKATQGHWKQLEITENDIAYNNLLQPQVFNDMCRQAFITKYTLKELMDPDDECNWMSDSNILLLCTEYGIPLLVATDGGGSINQESTHYSRGSSAMALGIPGPTDGKSWQHHIGPTNSTKEVLKKIAEKLQKDLHEIANITKELLQWQRENKINNYCLDDKDKPRLNQDNVWEYGYFIPLLIRTRKLPVRIGSKQVICSHGECDALNMALETIPNHILFICIIDSSHVRETAVQLRDEKEQISHRKLIRKILPNVGTSMGNRLIKNLDSRIVDYRQNNLHSAIHILDSWLVLKTCDHGKRGETYLWPSKYLDRDDNLKLVEINSHQLNNDGTIKNINVPLAPNNLLVQANHVADTVCSMTMGTYKSNKCTSIKFSTPYIRYPPDTNEFGFTHNSTWIDGDTTEAVHNAFHK